MRLIGAIWLIFLIWFTGRNSGSVIVYLEAWAIIGSLAMMMAIFGIALSLTLMLYRYSSHDDDLTEEESKRILKSNMIMCGQIGFMVGSLLGVHIANVVIS